MTATPARADQWLTTICRPVILLTLTALVAARWLGLAAQHLVEPEVLALYSSYSLVISIYFGGRWAEKIAPMFADALRRAPPPPPPA